MFAAVTGTPSTVSVPFSGIRSPRTMSTVVVLPAPVPPTMPTVLLAAIARFSPSSAGRSAWG